MNQLAVSGDNRAPAVLYEHVSCSRTRASRIPRRYKACFRRFRWLLRLCRRFVVSHGWIPPFAGMTHAGLAGSDAAVVSSRRLRGKLGPQRLDEGFGLINCPVRIHFHDVIAADFVERHMRTQLPSIACTVVQRLDACFPPDAQCKFLREQNRAARAE